MTGPDKPLVDELAEALEIAEDNLSHSPATYEHVLPEIRATLSRYRAMKEAEQDAVRLLARVIGALPLSRDWLDPDLEKAADAALARYHTAKKEQDDG